MTAGRQWALIGGLAAAAGAALFVVVSQGGAGYQALRIGDQAPDFSAMTLAGLPTANAPANAPADTATGGTRAGGVAVRKSLADYRGEVVLLNIWATWCTPCRAEMPSIQRLEERLGPKGLKIVAVSVDAPGMEERIVDFGREFGLSFELLYDAPGVIQRDYQSTGVPETFVIGRDGRVRRRIMGAHEWSSEANVAFLERLLAEPAA